MAKKTKDNPLGLRSPAKADNPHNLNLRQYHFAEFYIQTGNGTTSASLAGFGGKNPSNNTLAVQANRLLRDEKVKAHLSDRYAEIGLQSDEVLARLGVIARGMDITRYVKIREVFKVVEIEGKAYREFERYVLSVNLEAIQEDGFSPLIKKLKQNAQGGIEIEWHNQKEALETIGRFIIKQEIDHNFKGGTVNIFLPDNGRGDSGS